MLSNVYAHNTLYNAKNMQHIIAIQQTTGGKFVDNGKDCQLLVAVRPPNNGTAS